MHSLCSRNFNTGVWISPKMSHQRKSSTLQYHIAAQSLFDCFRGLTNCFIYILLKCTCTNVSSAILSLLSLIEMRKCICDSDFSQNVPNVILRVFDVAFRNAFY